MRITRSGISALLALLAAPLQAQTNEPTAGPYAYHQLRVLSGLGGSGYGLDSRGRIASYGAVAFSTPVAYALGRGQWFFGGGQYSFSHRPIFSGSEGNWTIFLTHGETLGDFNVAITEESVNDRFEQIFNVQIQYVPRDNFPLTGALGVADIGDTSKTVDGLGRRQSSRSFFGVLTGRLPLGKRPLYLSAGVGTHRYHNLFASSSYALTGNLRLWTEYDGYGNNSGILLVTRLGHGRDSVTLNNLIGIAKGHYFLFSTGFGF